MLPLIFGLIVGLSAQAHFVFIVPEADGSKAVVVFSDGLEPDENIDVARLAKTTLTLRDSSGKETALTAEKGKHELHVAVPGDGDRLIFGTTDAGVLQKGTDKPFRLLYHPKTIVGAPEAAGLVGKAAPIEIVPVVKEGKVRFRVLVSGKPTEAKEVTVMVPGSEKKIKSMTDNDGFTPPYDGKGRYGVYARHVEAAAGESDGKKFDETRHYATLVFEVK